MTPVYILIALLVVGGAALHFSSRRGLKSACEQRGADLRLELQRQIDALTANVRSLEQKSEGPLAAGPTDLEPASEATASEVEEITPEILRSLTETITALLGRRVRIRAVKILQTPESSANSWVQQGRAVIQASRNFQQRERE